MHTPILCLLVASLVALGRPMHLHAPKPKRLHPVVPFYGIPACSGKFSCKVTNKWSIPKCISANQVCDGQIDCSGGEDENERYCPKKPFTCPDGYYRCLNEDKCIPANKVCNKQNDCQSGDDEQQCLNGRLACAGGDVSVPFDARCDGKQDCPNGDDETNCTKLKGVCNCPDKWISFQGKCYFITDLSLVYDDSDPYCKWVNSNSSVVEVDSAEEMALLQYYLQLLHKSMYIGLTDLETESTWVLPSTGEEPSYIDWAEGQPDGDTERNCALISRDKNFQMRSIVCDISFRTFCEM